MGADFSDRKPDFQLKRNLSVLILLKFSHGLEKVVGHISL
jgi:hypothetical protein